MDQNVDQWGNLLSMTLYDYNGSVRRTYTNAYNTNSNLTSRYIRNRLWYSQVSEGGITTLLTNNVYDAYTSFTGTTGAPGGGTITCSGNFMSTAYTPRQFDSNFTNSFTYRGNLTQSQTLNGTTCMTQYDNAGNVLQTTDASGVILSSSVNSNTNYAAPSAITVGSLTESFSYASNLLPTQDQGPNGDTSSTVYDSYARPAQSTSKTGAVTYFNYINSPPQVLAYTNPNSNSVGRIVRTTLDGFGRTVKAESGTGTYSTGAITMGTVISQVDTTYDSCGCSPLGKLKQTSRPHAPGATVYWTVYNYDGIGRTKSVVAPDGASTTRYSYSGANVTVTDAASKWKTFTTDAAGNLTTVQEPDPNLGTVTTSYTYDVLNRLRTVSMPRDGTTQTRTFTYTGAFLTSATNPENGTVTNTYNTDNTLANKIDAKGQKIAYSYDSYKRVTQVSKYPNGTTEDTCQRVNYYYDSNPDTSNYQYLSYLAGRLATVHYSGANCTASTGNNYVEMYAYSQAGQVLRKTFRLRQGSASGDLEAVYTYDSEGKMASQSYPLGTTYQYTYDSLGRPTKMTDTGTSTDLVSTVTYGPAGELLSMTGSSVGETRTYNSMGQLTHLTGLNGVNLTYNYSTTGANNGQMASQYDATSGETITYAYDSLKRLASASSTQGWGQGFGYDGFGNLTAKSAVSGAPPVGSYPTDASTNRLSGISYDANGNQLYGGNGSNLNYDVADRTISSTSTGNSLQGFYEYGPSNRRVYQLRQYYNGSNWIVDSEEFYFYGVSGQRLGTYWTTVNGSTISWHLSTTQVFFQGKLIQRGGGNVQEDIRASIGRYYPYGEDRDSTTNDAVKFATYTRDSVSGLDYADQRYFSGGAGSFTTADPTMENVDYLDSGSWNAYSYANRDPINLSDPSGLVACGDLGVVGGGTLRSAVLADTDQGHFIDLVWHEGGTLSQAGGNVANWSLGFDLIAQSIWNRYQIVSGHVAVVGANGRVYSVANNNVGQLGYLASFQGHLVAATLNNVLIGAAFGTTVLTSTGQLANTTVGNMGGLVADLNQDQGDFSASATRTIGLLSTAGQLLGYVTSECASVIKAMWAANGAASGTLGLNTSTFFPTSWNSASPINNPNYKGGVENFFGTVGRTNFFGFSVWGAPAPIIRRPPRRF